MTKRLTKEREDEIKAEHNFWLSRYANEISRGQLADSEAILELLEEIDALRAENEKLKASNDDLTVINEVLTDHSATLESMLRSKIHELIQDLSLIKYHIKYYLQTRDLESKKFLEKISEEETISTMMSKRIPEDEL